MMNETGFRRTLPDQLSGSGHTFGTPRQTSITNPILSKRVCFYKSGDPQFNGLRMVINNRTFKTFDALLDSLSKKVPLPFGVRNITTPRGVHAICNLDELEDGKSYICSDSRKVKPINLAVARKKLPPWYHARPVSSRRRTVQKARFFPGHSIRRQEPLVMRTPKKLLVFCNGDPSIKRSVVLHKRTTPTFESILGYISELMQFPVVKLHTPDGRRVDGLPGLIMCSGTVVAVGREPFKPSNYTAKKSASPTSPTQLPSKRMGGRRLKAVNRKKKTPSNTSKSRIFSPSSERYIVSQIQNSITESLCNPTNSVELESSRILDSGGETEMETCLGNGAEGQDCALPTDDDIEKSFRVNQDGSMTVEMRVRLTIKEEETVHWTTTLTRSTVANQLTFLPDLEQEEEICSAKSNPKDLHTPSTAIETTKKEDPTSLGNEAFSQNSFEEDKIQVHTDEVSTQTTPTPGQMHIKEKQTSVESITSVTADGIQEGMVGSYSYREQIENVAMTEQYCMVKQSSTRPVPKPRRLGSVDANSRQISTFKSAEILQIESSEEEVTETVMHIYEQQTCQDNFLANFYTQGMSASAITVCRPATSDTGHLSSSSEFEPEPLRPSTASESISIWQAESMSLTSDLTLPSLKRGAIQATNAHQQSQKLTKSKGNPKQREVNNSKRVSAKPKVTNKRIPEKRQKENSGEATEKRKKGKTFSSAGFIKRIYGTSSKNMMKLKKRQAQNKDGGVTTKSLQVSDDTIIKDPDIPTAQENMKNAVSLEKDRLSVSPPEVSQLKGTLKRQTSMHQEKKSQNDCSDLSESMSLPAFNSSSSVTNEYVAEWLEKAQVKCTVNGGEESKPKAVAHVDSESGRSKDELCVMSVAEEETSKMQTVNTKSLPENVLTSSVKQRIQCFESKSSDSSVKKAAVTQQMVHKTNQTITTDAEHSLTQKNTDEIKPLSNGISYEISPLSTNIPTETPSDIEVESKSRPIKIQFQEATLLNTPSMDLPPPPPPESLVELSVAEKYGMDLSSVASSPLYRVSSVSSHMSEIPPLSVTPASDKAISPTDHTMEMTTSIETDNPSTLKETPLPRVPSVKRVPLVSNLSLERKMSLRRESVDKYTLCSDVPSSTDINIVGDNVLLNGICLTEKQQTPEETHQSSSTLDLMSSESCCTSASPASFTSEERESSASILSSEATTPSSLLCKKTKTIKTLSSTQKEAPSPKPLVKNVKQINSPSPERKPQMKKFSSEVSNTAPKSSLLHNHPSEKTMSPNVGKRKIATPPASPASERKQNLHKSKQQKITSPYSQSLDMVSPPVKQRSNRLSRNLSSDSASEEANRAQRKPSPQRMLHQTPQPTQGRTEKTQKSDTFMPLKISPTHEIMAKMSDDLTNAEPLNISNQLNMKPVLEKICSSIKSIRQSNERRSCLERSNSLPDFSSHVASIFGSSSKALLAFLSIMSLKDNMPNLNVDVLNADNVTCAEALQMIDSLSEIASIEDSYKLKNSLSNLQQSASQQLLQNWRDFQQFSNKCESSCSTPNYAEQGLLGKVGQQKVTEENHIDEVIDNLDIPEVLKEELASLSKAVSMTKKEDSVLNQCNFSSDDAFYASDTAQEDKANVDVGSTAVKKSTDIKQSKLVSVKVNLAKGQDMSSANKVAEQNQNQHVHKESELSDPESNSEQEGQLSANCYVELNISRNKSRSGLDSESNLVKEEQLKDGRKDMSNKDVQSKPAKPSKLETKQPNQTGCMGLDMSADEDASDVDEAPSSEGEQQDVEPKRLKVIVEESLSDAENEQQDVEPKQLKVIVKEHLSNTEKELQEAESKRLNVIVEESLSDAEEEEESIEEEEHVLNTIEEEEDQEELIETKVKLSSEDENSKTNNNSLSNIIDRTSLINYTESCNFDAEGDSGNDHSSYTDHADIEQPKTDEQFRSSTELSNCEKELNSDDKHVTDRYIDESTEYQQAKLSGNEKIKHHSEDIISHSVAERVSLLEKQVANTHNRSSNTRSSSQRNVHFVSDVEDSSSESPSPQSDLCASSAPQSSLSFSYDSSNVITTQPEGNRVKSIREMFLAKSATDVQQGQICYPGPKTSDLCDLRAETSVSGGYQSQTSSDLSSGEDDSSRKSITKGFVRRTIERLYGKKDSHSDVDEISERPPSAPKQKKKDHTSIFSPFHTATCKAMSELSYFNSTNALDTLTEARRCLAFNAQVGPGDSLTVDEGRWLLRDNTLIRKSVSDPVGINKTLSNSPQKEELCEDTEDNSPYSLFNTKSDEEDNKKSFSRKCTYFSLPHGSDSDPCQDDLSSVSKSSMNGDTLTETKDDSEDTKTWAERNGTLPGVISDFKMMDNKVHPLVEVPPDGEVVVAQPVKNQSVVNKRYEPDMLDFLYNFCGQHCPIL
ncbi:oxygen-regulated protein 1-like isoform X2 [Sphaeramia orbicularis]|uniref:oxygen-regulated protein 1-like isoform X2 n=1 Tax=Sphaeramia orbicularis TaxID=375764 RepID=UPI00117C6563|nr:oxygen-regulated protein 1 isoform X2 [Sphaeramia orbicularis]